MKKEDTPKKVIIIGAGLSGLTAARDLLKKYPNLSVTVIQAMERVGGRTNTVKINGFNFDLGAEFIGQTQIHIIELAQECGNVLKDTFHQGTKMIQMNDQVYTYNSDIPNNLSIWGLIQMQVTIWKINTMAKKVPTLDPKDCQLGYYWDSMTTQSWIDNNVANQKLKLMIQVAIRTVFGADPCQISFLFFLWFIHQNKDFDNLINVHNGLQQKNTTKGTQFFSIYLAQIVEKMGGQIQLGIKVKSILQKEDRCYVMTSNGKEFVSDYLIMACAPWQANKIEYTPPLSTERKLLNQRSFMGSYIKVIILYKKAYWRVKGFSGEIITDCKDSPLLTAFDDCKTNQNGEVQPALLVFLGGNMHRYWKQREDLQQQLIRKIATILKQPEMLHPIAVKWKAWEDQQTIGGGPTGNFGPGVLTQISEIRKPQKNIHWAGTEMATVSAGYMDGAVESGKRAAAQVSTKISGKYIQRQLVKKENDQKWYTRYLRGTRKWIEWL